MSNYILYMTVILLVVSGLAGMMYKRNLIKIVISLNIMESGINLFLIVLGYRPDGTAPLFTLLPGLENVRMALPSPQALILTNIVIGFATSALMLTFAVITCRHNGTMDTVKLRGIEEDD